MKELYYVISQHGLLPLSSLSGLLELGNNAFTGSIPSELGRLPEIRGKILYLGAYTTEALFPHRMASSIQMVSICPSIDFLVPFQLLWGG